MSKEFPSGCRRIGAPCAAAGTDDSSPSRPSLCGRTTRCPLLSIPSILTLACSASRKTTWPVCIQRL